MSGEHGPGGASGPWGADQGLEGPAPVPRGASPGGEARPHFSRASAHHTRTAVAPAPGGGAGGGGDRHSPHLDVAIRHGADRGGQQHKLGLSHRMPGDTCGVSPRIGPVDEPRADLPPHGQPPMCPGQSATSAHLHQPLYSATRCFRRCQPPRSGLHPPPTTTRLPAPRCAPRPSSTPTAETPPTPWTAPPAPAPHHVRVGPAGHGAGQPRQRRAAVRHPRHLASEALASAAPIEPILDDGQPQRFPEPTRLVHSPWARRVAPRTARLLARSPAYRALSRARATLRPGLVMPISRRGRQNAREVSARVPVCIVEPARKRAPTRPPRLRSRAARALSGAQASPRRPPCIRASQATARRLH